MSVTVLIDFSGFPSFYMGFYRRASAKSNKKIQRIGDSSKLLDVPHSYKAFPFLGVKKASLHYFTVVLTVFRGLGFRVVQSVEGCRLQDGSGSKCLGV